MAFDLTQRVFGNMRGPTQEQIEAIDGLTAHVRRAMSLTVANTTARECDELWNYLYETLEG